MAKAKPPPPFPRWRKDWEEFLNVMAVRLQTGHERYGDGSFEKALGGPEGLLANVEEEALDIVGWGYIAWTRIRRLRRLVEALDKGHNIEIEF